MCGIERGHHQPSNSDGARDRAQHLDNMTICMTWERGLWGARIEEARVDAWAEREEREFPLREEQRLRRSVFWLA